MSNTYGFYTPHLYASEEKESLLKKATATGIAEGSYAEKISDNGSELWIRTFLVNHAKTGPSSSHPNGWSIDKNTSWINVQTAKGAPLVLKQDQFGNADHPEFNVHADASTNFQQQSKYKIGSIERVLYSKDDDSYYADCKITDPEAKAFIRRFNEKRIPLQTSPQLLYDSSVENPNGPFKKWTFSHLAIVSKGASQGAINGPQMVSLCNGDGQTCKDKLQRAALVNTAAASASSLGLEMKRDTSSADALLGGAVTYSPPNGKRPGRLA